MPNDLTDTYPRIVGDIGGTHARFAMQLSAGMPISEPQALPSGDFSGPAEAILQYLKLTGLPHPRWAGLAIATPISGDMLAMTNNGWKFSVAETREKLALTHLRMLNDFTALALALPKLEPGDLVQIGTGKAEAEKPMGLIGPGTGLGVSGLVHCAQGYSAIEGEGGHMTLPAFNAREAELIALARKRFPHVSAERLLSGPGLMMLYEVISESAGTPDEKLQADEISKRGIAGSCPVCRETMDTFCAMLGTVAADVALTLGARGGVYIGGGIVPKLGDYFASSPFRARFEEKGRFSSYLAKIPTWVIHAPWPGLIGAASALDDDAGSRVA
ncbi:MAG TPA: glucokinase [Gallionella sp.]|nr:glucokinase [Gallionella sp.]